MELNQILNMIADNWDVVVTLLVLALTWIRKTRWGAENAAALVTVMQVIEDVDSKRIKAAVRARQAVLPSAINRHIDRTVDTVDPKRDTPAEAVKLLKSAGVGSPDATEE